MSLVVFPVGWWFLLYSLRSAAENDALFGKNADPPDSAAVSQSVRRLRKRFGELLRERVSATVEDASLVDAEIRELLRAISETGAE